jgi:hypothetical protein
LGLIRKIIGYILVCIAFFPGVALGQATNSVIVLVAVSVAVMVLGCALIIDRKEIARSKAEKLRNRAPFYTKADSMIKKGKIAISIGSLIVVAGILLAFFTAEGSWVSIFGTVAFFFFLGGAYFVVDAKMGEGFSAVGSLTYHCPSCGFQFDTNRIPADRHATLTCPNCGIWIRNS